MNQHDNTTMVESQRPQHVSDRNGRNGHAESPALAADYLNIDSLFTPDEGALRLRVRNFVDERVKPHIADWYENAHFPTELVAELGQIGLLGMAIEGYGCPGRSYVEYGLANMELEAGDSGLRTFVSVQSSLAMSAIYKFGSEAQKNQWLPGMAKGQLIGCFGLTEPDAGSDPAGMQTIARRDGEQWTISGTKRWIGLASIAAVWAKTDEGVRGFLAPTSAPGFTATPIQPKLAMRASIQCEIHLDNVRLTEADRLPLATGLTALLTCLDEARYGILWGVVGAARDSYQVALDYTLNRHQFNRPIASFQIAQQGALRAILAKSQMPEILVDLTDEPVIVIDHGPIPLRRRQSHQKRLHRHPSNAGRYPSTRPYRGDAPTSQATCTTSQAVLWCTASKHRQMQQCTTRGDSRENSRSGDDTRFGNLQPLMMCRFSNSMSHSQMECPMHV